METLDFIHRWMTLTDFLGRLLERKQIVEFSRAEDYIVECDSVFSTFAISALLRSFTFQIDKFDLENHRFQVWV